MTKHADELRQIKFQMMMSKSESDMIDDWRFANRIESKAEAIRQLVNRALAAEIEAKERDENAGRSSRA